MKKVLGYILLIFSAMVLVNYLSFQWNSFLSPQGFARADQSLGATISAAFTADGTGSSINFSFFDKGGIGRSYISQGYGHTPYSYRYINNWHNGIDIAAHYGTRILSPATGTVIAIGNQDDYCPHIAFGKFVVMDDSVNHLVLLFAHLGTIAVPPGATVGKDQLIGTVGATGFETGTHLHFSIFEEGGFSITPQHGCGPYPDGHDVDPFNYLGTTYQ